MTGDELPDRRRHGYKELEDRLDEHADAIAHRFQRRFRGMLIAFAIIGITSTVALIGFGIVLQKQGEQADRIEQLAEDNRALTLDIQKQREASIRKMCEDQNKRNENTSAALIEAAEKDMDKRKSGLGKLEVRRRRDVTLALIDALQPVQDCDKIAAEATGKEHP